MATRSKRRDFLKTGVAGYAENAVVGNGHLDRGVEIITKPFVIANLGNKIREMIER